MFNFTEQEKASIAQAVKHVESVSSGEIVPVFSEASSAYRVVSWRLSAMCMGVVSVGIMLLSHWWLLPGWMTPGDYALAILASGITGWLIPRFSRWIRVGLATDKEIAHAVNQAAELRFLEEGVYKTRERTGILIYISYQERKVVVLGDEGINAKMSSSEWESIVQTIVQGIRSGRVVESMVNAIHSCEEKLLGYGFIRRSDDFNELPDNLRH